MVQWSQTRLTLELLKHSDVSEEIDRRIAEAVARWMGTPPRYEPYAHDPSLCPVLAGLMERSGRRGQLAEVALNGQEAFLYICARPNGETFAQGIGSTPSLAICDAFLSCREDEPPHVDASPARSSAPPPTRIEPLFQAVGFRPDPPHESPGFQCVNCGWEGPEQKSDPKRCPSCRRHFLKPAPRRTR